VLEIPPVESALTAVRQHCRRRQNKRKNVLSCV
jgi:hypothetical protein